MIGFRFDGVPLGGWLGVDAIGQSFFDDDGVTEITFGLRKQVANGHGLACARHAQQDGVLRGFVVLRAGDGWTCSEN